MSLVQYSDSESDADKPASPPAKKPRRDPPSRAHALPPLPPAFHDLYASSTRVSVNDDPSLHGGRKRVIPHVEGNWPTHVYLECVYAPPSRSFAAERAAIANSKVTGYPAKDELALLADLLARAEESAKLGDGSDGSSTPRLRSLLHSDLGAQLPLHISLSAPVVLRTDQRASFTEALTTSIRDSHIPPFTVTPDALQWVSNHERTRWFLVLHVAQSAGDGLTRLLTLSNRALAAFDQPPLYTTPSSDARPSRAPVAHDRSRGAAGPAGYHSDSFHVSLAWSLDGPSKMDAERVAGLDLGLEDLQAFQAAHFPGNHQALNPPAAESAIEDDAYADEDDLGYYPDGAKRTLTDEQIRIFRHSEIHALRRARQLEQDDAEYEARARQLSDDTGTGAEVETQLDEPLLDEKRNENLSQSQGQGQGQTRRGSSGGGKSQKRGNRETRDKPSETLDYEDHEQSTINEARPAEARAPYPSRRIISYED
ncbi:uncharacterized protein N7482_008928 [Penicillium canariense]|uniref:U6 snRNA phosphodiesterase n=1 Tax=Penicillium canariense TaxID=189055 RepID=A0A9W9LJ08_9EURO|nr:uncharacterized protein N7482_008928 [Penicillium canariense]KAJ5157828.1 hypothetical protein N7482_008928 [Penicillium canariense]